MGRRVTGSEILERARHDLKAATTAAEIRTVQAVLLPIELGLSLDRTAALIGRSPGWVATHRRRYINGTLASVSKASRGGRRRSLLSEAEETQIVKRGIMLAAYDPWTTPRRQIRKLIEERIGDVVPDSTLYAIISRVARKLVPDAKAADLTHLSRQLTEKWLRERVEVQKKVGKKFSV